MEKNSSIDNNVDKDLNLQTKTNRLTRDIIENESDIPNNSKTILVQTLIQLYRIGFRKLIPLHVDSRRANVYDNLISEHEITQFPSAEGKPVRIIYENVNFWTETRLQEKSHLFYNVATTFGLTDLKDSKGRALYLYGVDIDSRQAYEALKSLLETLNGITFV
ncbi:MAG: hypothetical protein WBQ25_22785, partial [Nitrososphaeraceae archaeon]